MKLKKKNELGKIFNFIFINQTKQDPDPHKSAADPQHWSLGTT